MRTHSRRQLVLVLPSVLGLRAVSRAEKPGAEREKEKERHPEREPRPAASSRPWFTKPKFLAAAAGVIAAMGGLMAAVRRSSARG
jgi:hypothetical protein